MILTGLAKAADHHVPEIGLEAMLLYQKPLNRKEKGLTAFDGLAAFLAYQVMMMAFLGVMVDEMVTGLTLEDTPGLLEDFQGAIDSRFVHSRHLALHTVDDMLCGEM